MTDRPDLSLLTEHLGPESLRRAEAYLRRGALRELKVAGPLLRGLCQGSRPDPYRVQVELPAPKTLGPAHCTCPVGEGGRCKHVAALLLQWHADPESFAKTADLDRLLQEREAPELRAMLRYVLGRHPDLEDLLQMPFPNPHAPTPHELPEVSGYRRQVQDMFRDHARRHSASSQLADALGALVELAQAFADAGQRPLAAKVLGVVGQEVLLQLEAWQDQGGFVDRLLSGVCDRCEAWLTEPLPTAAQDALFAFILQALGAKAYAPVTAKHAQFFVLGDALSEPHRAALIALMREALRQDGQDPQQSVLLFHLEAPLLPLHSLLARCQALGLEAERVAALLGAGRVQEALDLLANEAPEDVMLLEMIAAFPEDALPSVHKIVLARYTDTGSLLMLQWLIAHPDPGTPPHHLLPLAQAHFYRAPGPQSLEALRHIATAQGAWPLLWPSVLRFLDDAPHLPLKVRALVGQGQVAQAAEALERAGGISSESRLELGVFLATEAESLAPDLAISLYQRAAQHLIEGKSLANFSHAASLLAAARRLSEEQSRGEEWTAYRQALLERFGRYQGLREAMERVGV